MLQEDSLAKGNVFEKLKICPIVTGCRNIHWSKRNSGTLQWILQYKVCPLLLWWTKLWLYSTNTWDTVTKVEPLCSLYQALSHEPNITFPAWFLPMLVYLSMSFAISRMNGILKSIFSVGNSCSNVELGLCDGTWYTEDNGTTFVTVSRILME